MLASRGFYGEESMPPKPGYKQPGREGKVSLLIWVDPELRTALKIAALERGETVQAAIERFISEYAADASKRLADLRAADKLND